ncbi:hypothetical protein V2A60_002657 [Cordyceps javanica]|uniref:Mfs monocarboxylate transporter protein n=1 Tax=Cordyceps javanica TaxID=43265 RepID=A0A545UXY5_9HYPO|nr:mfs monocarboxylate transporter protein [Cordyceps javanica]TQW06184.1 major facilitator superfamily [Cordyceps javanica]
METEPDDGNWVAWTQVAAAFALYFNHLGLLNSFGVFQTYYVHDLLRGSSPSAVSWIGSVQVFCLFAVGVVIGPLYDAGHCRALVAAGAGLVLAGLALTSVAARYWQLLLAQGVCTGLGACCLAIPSIAIVPAYFDHGPRRRRRATAMATATVGSGLGATLYPLIFERARVRLGFGWAVRIMCFVALVWCLFALVVIKPRARRQPSSPLSRSAPKPTSWRFYIDTSAFSERAFVIFCVAIFFNNLVFFNPAYYLQSYALGHGMSSSSSLLTYLVSILNAATIPGRIVPSLVADRVGVLDTYAVVCAFASASIFYWTSVANAAGNVAFAVLYGFFSGGVVSLAQVVIAVITPDLGRLGTRLGMVSIIKGVASLIGPPISGAIVKATGGQYLGVQLFAAFGLMITAVLSVAMRVDVARMEMKAQHDDAAQQVALHTGVLQSAGATKGHQVKTAR